MTPPRLSIELVPDTAWWSNVRSNISKKDWEKCKDFVRQRSGNRCEICGEVGARHPIECHEIWEYRVVEQGDHVELIQVLVDLIALCPSCHRVKHIGRTSGVGGVLALERAITHLCKVNSWEPEEAELYIMSVFGLHRQRSQYAWKLDISFLATLGIEVPEVTDREANGSRT